MNEVVNILRELLNPDGTLTCNREEAMRLWDAASMSEEECDTTTKTTDWLRELGAVRPMSCVSDEVFVLGSWHEGHYPISWQRVYDRISRDFSGNLLSPEPTEQWHLFGFAIHESLTKSACERILSQLRNERIRD